MRPGKASNFDGTISLAAMSTSSFALTLDGPTLLILASSARHGAQEAHLIHHVPCDLG